MITTDTTDDDDDDDAEEKRSSSSSATTTSVLEHRTVKNDNITGDDDDDDDDYANKEEEEEEELSNEQCLELIKRMVTNTTQTTFTNDADDVGSSSSIDFDANSITVKCVVKDGRQFLGRLGCVDKYANVVLINAEETQLGAVNAPAAAHGHISHSNSTTKRTVHMALIKKEHRVSLQFSMPNTYSSYSKKRSDGQEAKRRAAVAGRSLFDRSNTEIFANLRII